MTNPTVMTTHAPAATPPEPALMRRGFPGPASAIRTTVHPALPECGIPVDSALSECGPPVPTPAQYFPRAIRVRRSPR